MRSTKTVLLFLVILTTIIQAQETVTWSYQQVRLELIGQLKQSEQFKRAKRALSLVEAELTPEERERLKAIQKDWLAHQKTHPNKGRALVLDKGLYGWSVTNSQLESRAKNILLAAVGAVMVRHDKNKGSLTRVFKYGFEENGETTVFHVSLQGAKLRIVQNKMRFIKLEIPAERDGKLIIFPSGETTSQARVVFGAKPAIIRDPSNTTPILGGSSYDFDGDGRLDAGTWWPEPGVMNWNLVRQYFFPRVALIPFLKDDPGLEKEIKASQVKP